MLKNVRIRRIGMIKKTRLILACLLLIFIAAGCETLKTFIKPPAVQFDNVVLKSASLFQGTLEFTFNVTNPNPVGLKLDGMTYQLVVEGKKMLEGNQIQGLALPALGTAKAIVPLTVNYMDSFNSLSDFFKKDTLSYELSGTFTMGIFTIPYSHKDVISIPRPPSVSVKGLNVTSMSLTGARLALELVVSNENPGRIDLKKINYAISLGGFRLVQGQNENISVTQELNQQTITIPISVDFIALGKSAFGMFSRGSMDYELSGEMVFDIPKIGPMNYPYKKSGQVGITR